MALERSLLHKYKSFAIGHEASKREILDAGVRDLISDDVESYLKIFNLQEKREPLTDTLIGFYENDSLKLKFTKMIKSDNYKAAY